jgi:phosphoglycolate phosphatase-like HAD superfamily hydrolase
MRTVLDELSRRGMPLAIASSSSRPSLSRVLDYLGLTHFFSVVAGPEPNRDPLTSHKKSPAGPITLTVTGRSGLLSP